MRSAFLLTLLFPALAVGDSPRPTGVVLLIADDLGLDLGCYGNAAIRTPHLDALAASGTRFTNAFASVASCSPSRATLYSGMPTHQSGQYGLAHATHNAHSFRTVQGLPKLLNAAGWRTGIIGKNHVQPKEVYPWEVEIGGGRNVVQMAQQAKKFITECGEKPFLLVMGYTDPHRAAKGFGNEKPLPGVPDVTYDPQSVKLPYHVPDTAEARADVADYYRSIARLDHGVGLLMKALQESGRDRDTLVIFLSDNGMPFPGAKTTLYDSGVHLPLIIRAPGKKSTVGEGMASWLDITPTILSWAGVKSPPLPGRSLLPILEQPNPEGYSEVFGSHQFHEITMYYPMRMVRTKNHKYILNLAHQLPFPFASDIYNSATWQGVLKRDDSMLGKRSVAALIQRPREELYDLTVDPHELNNLAGEKKHAEQLSTLRARLRAWQELTKDPWLVKYQHE